jgi:transposase
MRGAAISPGADSIRWPETMPRVGPITAAVIETLAPLMTVFRRSPDFAARAGLVPRRHATGGTQRRGATPKGRHDIRRLLVAEAMAVVHHASRKGAPDGSRLGRTLARNMLELSRNILHQRGHPRMNGAARGASGRFTGPDLGRSVP